MRGRCEHGFRIAEEECPHCKIKLGGSKSALSDRVIKPCPFCGSDGKVKGADDEEFYFRVECVKQGHTLDHWEQRTVDAIKVWNERAL